MAFENTRVKIHADNTDKESGNHPQWRGEDDREISTFACDGLDDGITEINSRLERMLDKAPSDSTANLLVRREKDGYRVFLKIRSAHAKFAGFIRGGRLIESVERVIKDVRGQIDGWKETRTLASENV